MTKVLIPFFRGAGLFSRYLKGNILSIIALAGLFVILHTAYSFGVGVVYFADSAARFDRVRVYAESDNEAILSKIQADIAAFAEVDIATIYTSAGTKEYMIANSPAIGGASELPESLFPAFVDVVIKGEFANIDTVKQLALAFDDITGVRFVSYGEEWTAELAQWRDAVVSLLRISIVLFALAGAVVIYQAISVSLYRYRREIRVYSMVGGTSSFISTPFLVMSALIGCVCSLLSFILYYIVYKFFIAKIGAILGFNFNLYAEYLLCFLIITCVIAVISGFLSTKNFVRKIDMGRWG